MLETDVEVTCPHCWETITLYVDLSVESQSYVEDCSVCCRPMSVSYTAGNGELVNIQVEAIS
jgi:hypothetical protein